MKASDRIDRAMRLTQQGKYEQALADFVWFHHHALEEDPALVGVRLSLALMFWIELGELYEPARAKLLAVRDDAYELLVAGAGDRDLFQDLEAINGHIEDVENSVEVYRVLTLIHPRLARQVFHMIGSTLIERGEFDLARKGMGRPSSRIPKLAAYCLKQIERDRGLEPMTGQDSLHVYIGIYVDRVMLFRNVYRGCGLEDRAKEIVNLGISSMDEPYRDLVAKDIQERLSREA